MSIEQTYYAAVMHTLFISNYAGDLCGDCDLTYDCKRVSPFVFDVPINYAAFQTTIFAAYNLANATTVTNPVIATVAQTISATFAFSDFTTIGKTDPRAFNTTKRTAYWTTFLRTFKPTIVLPNGTTNPITNKTAKCAT